MDKQNTVLDLDFYLDLVFDIDLVMVKHGQSSMDLVISLYKYNWKFENLTYYK